MDLVNLPLFEIGLGVIVFSWLVQIIYMLSRDKKMTWVFALLQFLGIVLLLVDMYVNEVSMDLTFYMQVGSGVGALLACIVLLAKK